MASSYVIGISNGANDVEKVAVAYLIANEALKRGNPVLIWLTGEGTRLSQKGFAGGLTAPGTAPVSELQEQFSSGGGRMYACPVCFNNRGLDANNLVTGAEVKGAAALIDFTEAGATVFNY